MNKVKDNAGAAGVDGQRVEQFEARAEHYLEELERALRMEDTGHSRSGAWRFPKGAARCEGWGLPWSKTASCKRH